MTLADWQTSPELIGAWRAFFASEVGKAGLEVLRDIGPANNSSRHNADHAFRNAAVLLGQVQCEDQMHKNIAMLGQAAPDPSKQPAANYGAKPEE